MMERVPEGWDDWTDEYTTRCPNCDSKEAVARVNPRQKDKAYYRCPECKNEGQC